MRNFLQTKKRSTIASKHPLICVTNALAIIRLLVLRMTETICLKHAVTLQLLQNSKAL